MTRGLLPRQSIADSFSGRPEVLRPCGITASSVFGIKRIRVHWPRESNWDIWIEWDFQPPTTVLRKIFDVHSNHSVGRPPALHPRFKVTQVVEYKHAISVGAVIHAGNNEKPKKVLSRDSAAHCLLGRGVVIDDGARYLESVITALIADQFAAGGFKLA